MLQASGTVKINPYLLLKPRSIESEHVVWSRAYQGPRTGILQMPPLGPKSSSSAFIVLEDTLRTFILEASVSPNSLRWRKIEHQRTSKYFIVNTYPDHV